MKRVPRPNCIDIPEHARESGVSFVLSLWASISAPWSRRISTTPAWPAVAARINGVKPFLSRCSRFAPRCNKTRTSSSCPPAQARVNAADEDNVDISFRNKCDSGHVSKNLFSSHVKSCIYVCIHFCWPMILLNSKKFTWFIRLLPHSFIYSKS